MRYDLLLNNDALEGGDTIFYQEKNATQRYHLCIVCRKRAIENIKQVSCSTCAGKTKKPVLPVIAVDIGTGLKGPIKAGFGCSKVKGPDNSKYYKW